MSQYGRKKRGRRSSTGKNKMIKNGWIAYYDPKFDYGDDGILKHFKAYPCYKIVKEGMEQCIIDVGKDFMEFGFNTRYVMLPDDPELLKRCRKTQSEAQKDADILTISANAEEPENDDVSDYVNQVESIMPLGGSRFGAPSFDYSGMREKLNKRRKEMREREKEFRTKDIARKRALGQEESAGLRESRQLDNIARMRDRLYNIQKGRGISLDSALRQRGFQRQPRQGRVGYLGGQHRPGPGTFLDQRITAADLKLEKQDPLRKLKEAFPHPQSRLFPPYDERTGRRIQRKNELRDYDPGVKKMLPSLSRAKRLGYQPAASIDQQLDMYTQGRNPIQYNYPSSFGNTAFSGKRMVNSIYSRKLNSFGRRHKRKSGFGRVNYGFSRYF